MPTLGIVIVHYHCEALLMECLSRLRDSDLADFRAQIVDNGSRAGIAQLIAGIEAPGTGRFLLVEPERNLGFAAAVNLGLECLIRSTPGDDVLPYLLLLNPDVLLESSTLGEVVERLEARPEVVGATCRLDLPSGEIDPACRRSEPTVATAACKFLGLSKLRPRSALLSRYNLGYLDPELESAIEACSGAFLLFRRQAFEQIGGRLDERFFLYGEDLDLCRRLRATGGQLRYLPSARALHIKGRGLIRPARVTIEFYRAIWRYYRKWGEHRKNPLLLAPIALSIGLLAATEITKNGLSRALTPRSARQSAQS